MDIIIDTSIKRRDERGFLVQFLGLTDVAIEDAQLGQIYFVTFEKKGMIRGNHYHTTKKEWFVPVEGRMKVYLKDLKTNETLELILNGNKNEYQRIMINPNIAHTFVSLTPHAAMINYSNKAYNPKEPDTLPYSLYEL